MARNTTEIDNAVLTQINTNGPHTETTLIRWFKNSGHAACLNSPAEEIRRSISRLWEAGKISRYQNAKILHYTRRRCQLETICTRENKPLGLRQRAVR